MTTTIPIHIIKFLLYFEVNLEYDTSELVKSTQEMNNGSLSKMGFTKISGRWVSKDGDHGGSSSAAVADFDEEDQAADMDIHNEEHHATNFEAGTSAGHQGDEIPSMSSFEIYMVNRLDDFAENQRNLHDLCVTNFHRIDKRFQSMDTRFMTLDDQIEAVHNQIFELQ